MRAQEHCQNWLAASKTVHSELMKETGHPTTEVDVVSDTERTWRENMALTTSKSVDSIPNFKYVGMAQYLGQQPKSRDVGSSCEAMEGERAITVAQRHMRRRVTTWGWRRAGLGCTKWSGGFWSCRMAAEPQSSDGLDVDEADMGSKRLAGTEGSEG